MEFDSAGSGRAQQEQEQEQHALELDEEEGGTLPDLVGMKDDDNSATREALWRGRAGQTGAPRGAKLKAAGGGWARTTGEAGY